MWSSECPLGAPPRGSLHFRNRISALPGGRRATLRTTHCRAYRRQQLEVLAFGADPYEPLEKAINVINRVLTVGSKKSAASNGSDGNGNGGGGGGRERWVQFGTVASSRLSLQDLTAKDAELDREATSRLLQEYLSLPVEEYSLLDPKWVVREQNDDDDDDLNNNSDSAKKNRNNNSFRVSIPLKDMLGVDICPQVSIEARPDPLNGQVTLIGTKAVLGSPGLDDMFRLKLVAVMRCRRNDRHLPGRPVQRLKQWAAKRRGGNGGGGNKNLVTTTIDAGAGRTRSSFSGAAVAEVVDIDVDQVDFSSEEDEEDDVARYNESESESGTSSQSFRFSTDLSSDNLDSLPASSSSLSSFEEARNHAVVTTLSNPTAATTTTSVAAQAPLLDCRVEIDMAVKVPGALRVVPNGLLGYAGSVITKTVLNAVLPNFLQLLSADFKQWVAGSGQRRNHLESKNGEGEDGSDSEATGSLFTPLMNRTSTTSSSSESTDI